jgi:hypothetical protein
VLVAVNVIVSAAAVPSMGVSVDIV